jgi:hypothetical protein
MSKDRSPRQTADKQRRNIYQIENMDEETKRKIKGYAGSHGLTVAEALKAILEEWEAAKK